MTLRVFLMAASSVALLSGCDIPAAPSAAGLSDSDLADDDDFGLYGPYETIDRP
jgi:hypothetical protein